MVVKQVVDVDAINVIMNKFFLVLSIACLRVSLSYAQQNTKDSTQTTYKKKVLDAAEVDFLFSYYGQNGKHSAVGGGIGTEKLTDVTPTIVVKIPVKDDGQITADMGISAYTSASSSNINPFDASAGASRSGGFYYGDDDEDEGRGRINNPTGRANPYYESTGASRSDALKSLNLTYSHSSDNRNTILSFHGSLSTEFDYDSRGFGAGITKLWNEKNTELGVKGQVYLDQWHPIYPTEIKSYYEAGGNLNYGFFNGVTITGNANYSPVPGFQFPQVTNRNSYSVSVSFSQILSPKLQTSVFFDVVRQEGLLSTPYHRMYFSDRPASFIEDYQLADDIERLPGMRMKYPIGIRLHYYVNEHLTVRSYYRYYFDNWGAEANTASIELPIKLSQAFTIYPMYRFYNQSAVTYFAPHRQHVSTERYYTSDYDLSAFESHEIGGGFRYTDIFQKFKIASFGFKSIDLRYNHYMRSDGLNANIISFAAVFTL